MYKICLLMTNLIEKPFTTYSQFQGWKASEVNRSQFPLFVLGKRLLRQDLVMQSVVFSDAELGQASVQTLQQDTGFTERLARDVSTAAARSLGGHLHVFTHREVLPRVDDVDDGARPHALQVFQVGPGIAAVCVGRIDALGGKVIQLFEVGV